jgi:hypothetical protein
LADERNISGGEFSGKAFLVYSFKETAADLSVYFKYCTLDIVGFLFI